MQLVSEKEQQTSVKISKLPTGPVIESTSVAPRQRPKASQQIGPPSLAGGGPGTNPLPLPLSNPPQGKYIFYFVIPCNLILNRLRGWF